jgi:peptide/nickel transport system permease protein
MFNYAVRRLAFGVVVVIAVTMVLFLVMQLMPGDPIKLVADPSRIPPDKIAELRHKLGLDRPAYYQYFLWLGRLLRGDFGKSIVSGESVSFLIATRLPYTLMLALGSLLLHYIIAVPLGLFAALRANSRVDRGIVLAVTVLRTLPNFWLGILMMILFAIKLKIFPISGLQGPLSFVLPVLTLTLPALGGTVRLTRSEVLETVREPFVLTAYAKGLPERAVRIRHILRNALIPVTVMFFLSLPWIVGGSVIIENIFAWPGMGRLLWKAITSQDLPIVQGVIVIIAVLTVVSNTIGDIISGLLDPRIRIELEEVGG